MFASFFIQGNLDTGGTKEIGINKTQGRNNQQPFQTSYASGAHSHDRTPLDITSEHIQQLSAQMGMVEDNIAHLLTNMGGTYATLQYELLEYLAMQVDILCKRMSNVQTAIQKVKFAKKVERDSTVQKFEHENCMKAGAYKKEEQTTQGKKEQTIQGKEEFENCKASPRKQTTQGKEEREKTSFKAESYAPISNTGNKKQKYVKDSKEANFVITQPKIKEEPTVMHGQSENLISSTLYDNDIFFFIRKYMPLPHDEINIIDKLLSLTLDKKYV